MATFVVKVREREDGQWVASVPSFPGCQAEGQTIEQAVERASEQVKNMLLSMEYCGSQVVLKVGRIY